MELKFNYDPCLFEKLMNLILFWIEEKWSLSNKNACVFFLLFVCLFVSFIPLPVYCSVSLCIFPARLATKGVGQGEFEGERGLI